MVDTDISGGPRNTTKRVWGLTTKGIWGKADLRNLQIYVLKINVALILQKKIYFVNLYQICAYIKINLFNNLQYRMICNIFLIVFFLPRNFNCIWSLFNAWFSIFPWYFSPWITLPKILSAYPAVNYLKFKACFFTETT